MINDPLFLVVAGSVIMVVIILMVGLGGFAQGGKFNKKHGNRMMRYRIAAQAVAIALILAYVLLRRSGG